MLSDVLQVTNDTSYTMNLAQATRMVLEELELLPGQASPLEKPLPWRPSLALNRRDENVRPIFWRNRNRSYVARTQDWDEFPNGRWGDSRSPAFGELDSYGIGLKGTNEQNIKLWGTPKSIQDLSDLFVRYMEGKLESLPWSEQAITNEASTIQHDLVDLNRRGFLTINSQPAVNGAKSSDPTVGWGPRNGYVYQKAYLEVLVSPEYIAEVITRIERDPEFTYYAVNKDGDLKTNAPNEGPNAVTWGVFPGKEIVQPTIVETVSFLAWKDEFYRLGQQWANCHAAASPSRYVIQDVVDTWYLLNIVHNDFHVTRGIFPLFDGLKVADMENELHTTTTADVPSTNGEDLHNNTNGADATNGTKGAAGTYEGSEAPNQDKPGLLEAAKSAAVEVTNGMNGLSLSN
jgi:methylenetetrahydrofolate reductase (NADPH)